jgi:PAS domain S-box-containing protein
MVAVTPDASAHLAAIISSSDDAIVSKSLDGIIITWNGAAERLFGYSPDEAIGSHISLIIPKDRLDEESYVIGRIRAGLNVEHYETVRQRKDGSFIDISLTVSPIHSADGTIMGASKIARDISEQKELQRVAEQASRAKDNFLATLSHELRTPLNTVLGYVQMLRQGSMAPDQQAKAIDVINRNATALARLVDDVLDTSRIVTGKMRVELQPCEMAPLVQDAIATIRPAADSKGVRIQTNLEDGLTAQCDTGRFAQILWNLLTNAVKFTPPGGLVTVTARRDENNVSIAVEDTGAGMAAHDLPLVFQRFWQGEGGRQTTAGLGLGLALTRHLIEMHGGSISATSDGPGRGAKFEILLPSPPPPIARL